MAPMGAINRAKRASHGSKYSRMQKETASRIPNVIVEGMMEMSPDDIFATSEVRRVTMSPL